MPGTYKILVVDNDMQRLADVYSKLVLKQYRVEVTVDWDEVLNRVKRFEPDLVIIKSEIPRFDGTVLCKSIKSKFVIPIILLVDKNSPTTLRIDSCEADAVIEKPVDGSQLLELVERFRMAGNQVNN
jgi:DNA-binding response OmpR family regulator